MNDSTATNNEDLDELLELYASESDVEEAAREKEQAEEVFEEVGVQVKDYPVPQREIDLHGQTGAEAMRELENFLDRSIAQRILTVRVITGKGLHSKHMISVLPELTEKKLAELRRDGKVLTFKREKSAGSFAVYLIS